MNEEQAFKAVRQSLKKRRYEHTERVVIEAEKLARHFGANVEKARLAAILHDYAKYRPIEEMRETVIKTRLDKRILQYGDEILHAFVGAYYVEHELKVRDEEVLSAIRYHTTGKAKMSILDKVIFLADYIEPGRSFEGVQEVRDVAENDLDKACFLALKNTIKFLVIKEKSIYPDTFEAYNNLCLPSTTRRK